MTRRKGFFKIRLVMVEVNGGAVDFVVEYNVLPKQRK